MFNEDQGSTELSDSTGHRTRRFLQMAQQALDPQHTPGQPAALSISSRASQKPQSPKQLADGQHLARSRQPALDQQNTPKTSAVSTGLQPSLFQDVYTEIKARREALRQQHDQDRQAAEGSLNPPRNFRQALENAYRSPDVKVLQRLELVSLGELIDLKKMRPKRGRGAGTEGAGALARLLDSLARHALQARRHDQVPNQIVFHTSVELLAETLDVPTSTIWRWTQLLEAEGYCRARTHYTTATNRHGERTTMVDGTLYAVRLKVGHPARVRYDDLKGQYRNLDADRRDRHTARHARYLMAKYTEELAKSPDVLDGKTKLHGSNSPVTQKWEKIVHEWAVTPGSFSDPLASPDPCNFGREEPKTVHDVVQRLSLLQTVRSVERSALINFFSGVLARELNDFHSRRWYAKLLWNALGEELSGWPGLKILGAQLQRLETDRKEWKSLRCPAALLAARLR